MIRPRDRSFLRRATSSGPNTRPSAGAASKGRQSNLVATRRDERMSPPPRLKIAHGPGEGLRKTRFLVVNALGKNNRVVKYSAGRTFRRLLAQCSDRLPSPAGAVEKTSIT